MATITPVTPVLAGIAPAPAACSAGGDTVANPKGNLFLRIVNGSGASKDVTVAAGVLAARAADGTYPAMTLAANTVSVGAGASRLIGPFPKAFNDASGNLAITYSAVTALTIEAIQL